jgi:putative tricarboxylic transport membrane protein
VSDRISGALLLVLAVAFGLTASGFEARIGDPLGPAVFPLALSIPLALLSLYLLFRPDPEPHWARGLALLKQGLAIAIFVAYAYLLEPLGFVITTFLGVTALGSLLGARVVQAAAAGIVIALVLFVLFHHVLSLPLPVGPLWFLD